MPGTADLGAKHSGWPIRAQMNRIRFPKLKKLSGSSLQGQLRQFGIIQFQSLEKSI